MASFARTSSAVGLLFGLLLLPQPIYGAEKLTLDQLIARNLEAAGGREEVRAVQAIRVNLHIADPGFEAEGVYYAARPARMRIDIKVGDKRVYAEAFDGKRGWQWNGKGDPVEESKTATNALRHGIELPDKLFGLDEMRQRGNQLELVGRETIENVNYYVLRLAFFDGFTTTLYVDPQTWMVTRRRDERPLHPDVDPTPTTIETTMRDFRKVGNRMFAFASTDTDLKTGKTLETATMSEITVNPPIPPGFFDGPALTSR
jgi:hypothetical protein